MQSRLLVLTGLFCILIASSQSFALDPRDPDYKFEPSVYPPGGFSAKKSKIIARPDPAQPKASPLIGASGKFEPWAQFYYTISTDPKAFEAWWINYWSDPETWKYTETPVFKGYQPGNQGHRLIAVIGTLYSHVQKDPDIDAPVKAAMCTDEWKTAAENLIRLKTIDPETGFLRYRIDDKRIHEGNLAQTFHFIRTKYGAMHLRLANIYTLDLAQSLVRSMLTQPNYISAEDKWLAPPNEDYLETLGFQKGGRNADVRMVKDGKVLYSGGMFIGWNSQPALHGTWDGLAILNQLFKIYPDPDPASPKSIFYKWNQLPDDKTQIARTMIKTCAQRLWLDWKQNNKPIWTWVRDGKPIDDDARPSEAPWMPAYDGYGENQLGWARQCCEELFGDPLRNTTDGCQALLAIANGKKLDKLTMPVGQQVPGRHDYDKNVQIKGIEADRQALADPKVQQLIKEKYGLTIEQANQRIDAYYLAAGLPPGAEQRDESPKLDPAKAGKTKPQE